MRHALLAACLLVTVPSFAQQPQGQSPLRLTVFASGHAIGYSMSEGNNGGSAWSGGGVGLALEYRWQRQWALELSLAAEKNDTTFVRRIGGTEESIKRSLTAYPVDLVGQYHFATKGHWKPYAGLGGHYNPAIDSPFGRLDHRFSAQVDLGVDYMLTPRLSLKIDAKHLFSRDFQYDPALKAWLGLGWRF
jgi:outer membrane protein W